MAEERSPLMQVGRWIYLILVLIISLIVIPLYLPISLMFRIYRNVLISKVKQKLGDDVMLAGNQDAVWLQDTPNNRTIINALLSVKGELDITMARELMMDRMVSRSDPDDQSKPLFPKLTMYTTKVMRRYVWIKEDKFDIKEHLYQFDKVLKSKEELQDEVGKIISTGLPEKKSPWEMILIPPIEGTDENIFLFRVHHSIADGISLVKSFVSCLADEKLEERKAHRFGTKGQFVKMLKSIIEGPGEVVLRMLKPKDTNILHGPAPTGRKRVAWSDQIDLDLIKKIKNATGTTVNDVLFSCLAGAFRDYMKANSKQLPQNICVSVPVDVRKSKKIQMDNQFAVVFLEFPMFEDDPVELLKITKRRMDKIKSSSEPIVNNLLLTYAMARMPNVIAQFLIDFITEKCSMIVSNVPGPAQLLTVNGREVDDLLFFPPQRKNVAFGISILSYNNHLRIGVLSDEIALTKPGIISDLFLKRLDLLQEALHIE